MHERGNRPIAFPLDDDVFVPVPEPRADPAAVVAGLVVEAEELERLRHLEIAVAEELPELRRRELAALEVGDGLDLLGELHLEAARQVEPVAVLQQIGDAALPRL